jgi:serine/threonine protein kinase
LELPARFGKYFLLEKLASGGMAEIYLAKAFGAAGFERLLVIKKILPSMAEDKDFIKMFIDEARIASTLTHSNIVQINELGKVANDYFIAMEHVPGKDLASVCNTLAKQKHTMFVPMAALIISKICEGLDYAHRKKNASGQNLSIIHRDVSPGNVLIGYTGDIKLIDFGIAKAANRNSSTVAGTLKGKFGYMSPEQARGLDLDQRSDVFSVGILLYEMLTSRRLFAGGSDLNTLEKVRNAEIIPPTTFNDTIPKDLEKIVLKALARMPEDRYEYASDLQEDLVRFLIHDGNLMTTKSLANFIQDMFADVIAEENRKLAVYRQRGYPLITKTETARIQRNKIVRPEDQKSEDKASEPDEAPEITDEIDALDLTDEIEELTVEQRGLLQSGVSKAEEDKTESEVLDEDEDEQKPEDGEEEKPEDKKEEKREEIESEEQEKEEDHDEGDDDDDDDDDDETVISEPTKKHVSAVKKVPEPQKSSNLGTFLILLLLALAATGAGYFLLPMLGQSQNQEVVPKTKAQEVDTNKTNIKVGSKPSATKAVDNTIGRNDKAPDTVKITDKNPLDNPPVKKEEETAAIADKTPDKDPAATQTANLIVESTPVGANILLNGKTMGQTPKTLIGLNANKKHNLILSKAGFQKKTYIGIKFLGKKRKTIRASLKPVGTPKESPVKKGKKGFLIASTKPWAKVIIDGRDTGMFTPVPMNKKIELSPGIHKVTFKTSSGKTKTVSVTIEPGKVSKILSLEIR